MNRRRLKLAGNSQDFLGMKGWAGLTRRALDAFCFAGNEGDCQVLSRNKRWMQLSEQGLPLQYCAFRCCKTGPVDKHPRFRDNPLN